MARLVKPSSGKREMAMNPKPKRRWYRFTLRTFLILILVVGGGSGWIAARLYEAARQRAAAAEIQAFGGTLADEFDLVGY